LVEQASKKEKISNLTDILNQYVASEPVRNVVEKMDISNSELAKDVLIDASDLILDLTALDCVSGTFYPAEETKIIPVTINLIGTKEEIIDPFLDAVASPLAQNRLSGVRKWINLIGIDEKNRALAFTDDSDYWRFVRAIRNSCAGRDAVFSCRCHWRRKESGPKAVEEIIEITCEVRGAIVRFVIGSKQGEVTTLDVKDIKAMSLSYDFASMHKYLIDIKFAHSDWLTKQALEMTMIINYGTVSRSYRTKLGGTITIALPEDLIHNGSAALAIRNGPKSSDAAIVGEHIFQFEQLMLPGTSTPKLDMSVMNTVALQTSTGRRMGKLTIYRANDLVCLNGKTPPNPFCSVYLLDSHKFRVGKSSKETKTVQQKKTQNPVWNTELELQGPQGIEGVEYVLVLLKDGSGILDKKPLGQVLIPISAFLFGQNETEVTMNIEATDKMPAKFRGKALGTLVIHAEVASINTPKSSNILLNIGKNMNPNTIQTGSAEVSVTTRLTNEFCTWWPLVPLSDAAGEKGRPTLTAGISSVGHVVWSFDSMMIRLASNATPVSTFREALKASTNTLLVPWSQVKAVDVLTHSVVMVTLTLTKPETTGGSTGLLWEFLVSPCPAVNLATLWKERKAFSDCRNQLKTFLKSCFNGTQLSAQQSLPTARAVMEVVEQHLNGINGEPLSSHSSLRIHVYLAQILEGCRKIEGGPVYDKAVVRKLCKNDCEADKSVATVGTPGGEIASAKVIKKVDFILDFAVARIRDYVLCCWEPYQSPTQSGLGCLEEMVNCYLQEIRNILAGFVGSKKALQLFKGQENRTNIVSFLVREELRLDVVLRRLLAPFRLLCRPQARLLEPEHLDAVLIWYNGALLDEMRSWLRKTLDAAKMCKSNTKFLPWDYDSSNGRFVSTLPESLVAQTSFYLDLRVPLTSPHAFEEERERARRVNDRILRAYGQVLLLLVEEYKKTFQMKNWGEASPTDNLHDICFVVSIVNDCYRLGSYHIEPYRKTDMISPATDDVAFTLIQEFNGTAEIGLKFLLKMCFAEAKHKFEEFDKQWATQTDDNSLVGAITVSLTNRINILHPIMEPFYYGKLLAGAVDVCASKYLTFIRIKSESGAQAKLSKGHVKRVQTEVTQWVTCFRALVQPDTDKAPINGKLQYLEEVRDLLCLDYSAPQYLELVHRICRKYCIDGRTAIIRMLSATVTLRTDGSFRLQHAVDGIANKFKDSPNTGEVDLLDDIYIRVFGDEADNKKTRGFGFFKRGSSAVGTNESKGKEKEKETLQSMPSLMESDEFAVDFEKMSQDSSSDTASTMYGEAPSESGGESYPILVTDMRVRGLKTSSLLSAANPYIKVVLNAQRIKTTVRWNSNNAVWKDFTMNFHLSTSNLASKSFIVIVYDKERVRRKRMLGTIKVPLGALERGPIEGWFTLDKALSPNDAPVGIPFPSATQLPPSAPCGQVHMRINLTSKS